MKLLISKILIFVTVISLIPTFNFAVVVPEAQAAINLQINYQGKLTNTSDVAVANGDYNMEFILYDAISGGTTLWTETRTGANKVTVTNGLFSVMLGSVTSLASVDFNQTVYLGVNIGGTGTPGWDGEMTPRKIIGAVPAAFLANGVNGTGGVRNTLSSATALAIAKAGTDYALQVDTSTASAVTGLKVTSAAAAGGLALSTLSTGTNENLSIDAKGSGTISLGATSTGSTLFGGGYGSTGVSISSAGNIQANGTLTVDGTSTLTGTITATTLVSGGNQCVQASSAGVISGTGAACGTSSLALSALTAAAATNSINNADYAQTWAWNTLSSNSGLTLSSTSIAAASNTQTVLNVATSGANGTSTQTTYGAQFANTHTGTSSTNVAAYFTASGGTNNYAAIFNSGNVGFGTTAPTHPITVGSTNFVTNGGLALYSTADQTTNYQRLRLYSSSGNVVAYDLEKGGTGATGYHSWRIAGSPVMEVDASQALFYGNVLTGADNNKDIGRLSTSPYRFRSMYLGTSMQVGAAVNTTIAATIHAVGATADSSAFAAKFQNSSSAELLSIRNDGNIGVGTASPTSLFSVGSSSQFQVNSSGAIAAVVGITSSSNYVQSAGTMSLTSANTTQVTTASAFALNVNSLTTGTGMYAASSTLTSGKLVDLQVSGTAAAASQTALNILTAGANATNAITTYGAQISNTHTNATSGTNIALYLNASGATTANYGLIVNAGNVGIGTTAPSSSLHVVKADNGTDDIVKILANNLTQGIGISYNTITAIGSNTDQNIIITPKGAGDIITTAGTLGVGYTPTTGTATLMVNGGAAIGDGTTLDATIPTNGLLVKGSTSIGSTTATSMFNVGTAAQFQVNSSGAIAAATGISSSGTIAFSGLSSNGAVYTSGGTGTLTTTAPTSGTLGYWSRSGTTISPATSGDSLSVPGAGANSEKFGANATAVGSESISMGYSATSAGGQGVAIGYSAAAGPGGGVAIGYGNVVSNAYGVSIGRSAGASAYDIALGGFATTTGDSGAIAIGYSTAASSYGIAIGNGSAASNTASIAIGKAAATTAANQLVFGSDGFAASDVYFGDGVTSATPPSITLNGSGGSGTNIAGAALNIAGGKGTGTGVGGNIVFQYAPAGSSGATLNSLATACLISGTNGSLSCPSSGSSSERFGAGTTAAGTGSIAIGNTASAQYAGSISIGYNSTQTNAAADGYGVAIGNSASVGYAGVALGNSTLVAGNSNIAIGTSAQATSPYQSVAIGAGAKANATFGADVAVGFAADGKGSSAVAIGGSSTGAGYSVVIGQAASAGNSTSNLMNIAIGQSASISSSYSGTIVLGTQVVATASAQFIAGSSGYPIDNVYFGKGAVNATPTAYTINGTGGSGTDIAGAALNIAGGKGTGNAAGGDIVFQTSTAGASGTTLQSLATKMMIQGSTGNVGINTTGPDRKLDILDASNPQLRLTYTDGSVYSDLQSNSSGDLVMRTTGDNFYMLDNSIAAGAKFALSDSGNNEAIMDLQVYRAGVYTSRFKIDQYGKVSMATAGTESAIDVVGIGTTAPDAKLEVAGNLSSNAWGLNGIQLQASSATYTDANTAASGTATNAVFNSFAIPTLAATNTTVTTTNAATVYIAGAPTTGTNQTITNAYSLWVDAGTARFDGDVTISGTCTGCGAGGSFSGEVDDATNDALTFTSDDASPPAGTVNSIFRDNTGDLNINTVSGKTLNLQIAGADEYNFSSTALAMNSNNITGLGTDITAAAALTLASGGAGALTLDSASNAIIIAATDTTLQRTASGTFNIDLINGSNTTLSLINSGAAAANLNVDGSIVASDDLSVGSSGAAGLISIMGGADNLAYLTSTTLTGDIGFTVASANNTSVSGGNLTLKAGNGHVSYGANGSDVFIYGGALAGAGVNGDVILAHTGSVVQGNVGVGDTSPASLFTVGSGDLFQINTSGQIGVQQAPVSDYLLALNGTTGNDNSRIIDIVQANDSTENSYGLYITGTQNQGTWTGATRSQYGSYISTAPTASLSNAGIINAYSSSDNISLSGITLGNSNISGGAIVEAGSGKFSVTGNPVFNHSSGGIENSALTVSGISSTVAVTPTLTAITTDVFTSYGGVFYNASSSAGAAALTSYSYGIFAQTYGNLTTTGATSHFGGYFITSGSADTNYGVYVGVSGATTNYSGIFTGGNFGIGTVTPTSLLSVGTSSEFQVNSSGAIAAVVGITSSSNYVQSAGTMSLTSANTTQSTTGSAVAFNANSVNTGTGLYVSTSALTSGSAAHISGSGATMLTGGELLQLQLGANTVGSAITINSTGAYTGTGAADGLINIVADSLTTGYGSQYSFTGLSSGTGLRITGGTAMTTNGELLDLNMGAATAGNGINIATTGVYTGTGLSVITANSATTGTIQATSATGLTTGRAQTTTLGSALTTGGYLNLTGASYLHTGAETGSLVSLAFTDASSNASGSAVTNGILLSPTINTTASAGSKTINGISIASTYTACGTTSGTCAYNGITQTTAAVTQTTTNNLTVIGNNISSAGALVQNTAAGVITWAGQSIQMPNITQTTGQVNAIGLDLVPGSITTGGFQQAIRITAAGVGAGTLRGITIQSITGGAGTETAISIGTGWDTAISSGGNYVQSAGTMSLTSANTTQTTTSSAFALNANSLTTGTGLNIESSSLTSGKLVNIAVASTAAQSLQTALNVSTTGTNASSSIDTYAAKFSNTHTGTSAFNIGVDINVSGGASNPVWGEQITATGNNAQTKGLTVNANAGSGGGAYSTAGEFTATAAGTSASAKSGVFSATCTSGLACLAYGATFSATGTTNTYSYGATFSATGGTSNYAIITTAGNVGIGDGTPTALFTVGSGDLFQVNSSGAIAAVVGITSSSNYVQSAGTMSLTSANTTQTTTSSALALNVNSLTTGTGMYTASSSLTSGKLVDLQVSGTAAAASQTALNILTTGANGTAGITTYGAQISNTHSTNTSTNVGLLLNATGGATANYALVTTGGNVGIGTTAPGALLTIEDGTSSDQLRIGDTSAGYYYKIGRNTSSGYLEFDGTQSGFRGYIFNNSGSTTFNNATNFIVSSNGSANMRITSTAAGATSISGLELTNSTQAYTWYLDNRGSGGSDKFGIANNAGTELFAISTGGNITLSGGATSATTTLDLGGTGTANAVCHTTQTGTNDEGLVDCTSAPAADFAEMYPVTPDAEVGDVVVTGAEFVNTYETAGNVIDWTKVKGQVARLTKSTQSYAQNVVGIVSDNYGDFISTGYNIKPQDNPKSIALVGRVPVKVSTENGEIKAGDFLTSSATLPGYAMKATTAGPVIGMALADFNSSATGKVMVFVKATTYNGVRIESQLAGLNFDYTASVSTVSESSEQILTKLISQIANLNNDNLSELNTDLVIANAEVISPNVTTGALRANTFASAASDGGIEVESATIFKGGLKVDNIGSLGSLLTFLGDVEFIGTPYLNKDTAGFAVVSPGATSVDITFTNSYAVQPIVGATISFEQNEDLDIISDSAMQEVLKQQAIADAQSFLTEGVSYVVTNKSSRGFTIVLSKPSTKELKFSWTAFAVKNANVFTSIENSPTPSNSDILNNEGTVSGDSTTPPAGEPAPEPVVEPTPEVVPPAPDPQPEVTAQAQ
jgi:hypothetical protein